MKPLLATKRQTQTMRPALLDWYRGNRRDLPWRKTSDAYAIWISEVMLQQTRVAAVVARYREFLGRFPTVNSLAEAAEEDLLALWSGLGYYRRARMLHMAAKVVVSEYGSSMPQSAEALRGLPGIGSYTAAAIASIAFGERVAVVDGNVERVLCRLQGWEGDPKSNSALRKKVESLAAQLVDPEDPGDFNQALMELGATVCLPRNPQCLKCPIANHCITRGEHKTGSAKPMLNVEIGHALVLRSRKGHSQVLLERRSDRQTVMPGLWELPALPEVKIPPEQLRITVRHAIMRTNYTVRIWSMGESQAAHLPPGSGSRKWVPLAQVCAMPLTGLTRKVLLKTKLLARKPNGALKPG